MIFRKAKEDDSPNVVSLLKLSLGESLVKKTDQIWNFKHHLNPFGKSFVLLAEENERLIGLRAFMQWNWQIGTKIWQAYRAVDTATHPDFQGKGVFKQLTLTALKEVGSKNDCFIFNTPNNNSKPGYLKMGWTIVDKIKLAVVPSFLYWPMIFFSKPKFLENSITDTQLEKLCQIYNDNLEKRYLLFTPKSVDYIRWRYDKNPIQEYLIVSNASWYIAFYVKKHKYFNELRVAEMICVNEEFDKYEIRKVLLKMAFERGCLVITSMNKTLFALAIYGNYGPHLTFKDLTSGGELESYKNNISNWSYQLGDLELF
jgi:GNAT superfamily N-acetyltransferase